MLTAGRTTLKQRAVAMSSAVSGLVAAGKGGGGEALDAAGGGIQGAAALC